MLDYFTFLRPLWLLAGLPALGLWLLLYRSQDAMRGYRSLIAPHLLTHLVVDPDKGRKIHPVHVLLPVWLCSVLALAGPSWRYEPSPFSEERGALVIVLSVRPSMNVEDVKPSRLGRARHKIHDLLDTRIDGYTGLVAYSGTAHLVTPLTRDPRLINDMAEALNPSVMPLDGDAFGRAMAVAAEQLDSHAGGGSILVLADTIDPNQARQVAEQRFPYSIQILGMTADEGTATDLNRAARNLEATFVVASIDDSDIRQVSTHIDRSFVRSQSGDDARRRDSGYLFLPFLALGTLTFARKGFNL